MPKKAKELSDLEVRRLAQPEKKKKPTPGHYSVGGVAGLALQVAETGASTWILRVKIGAKRRDMGLGGYPDVTLAQARAHAREARDLIDQGIDPILERQQAKSRLMAEQTGRDFRVVRSKVHRKHVSPVEKPQAHQPVDQHAEDVRPPEDRVSPGGRRRRASHLGCAAAHLDCEDRDCHSGTRAH